MTIEEVVLDMMRENTGSHFLDSGGAYGRHWERNQELTVERLKAMPSVKYEHNWGYTINVFHYLILNLSLDDLCERFNSKCVPAADWDGDYYGVSSKAMRWLNAAHLVPHYEFGSAFNTYNHESNLSQVLQGQFMSIEDDRHASSYVLLQLHNGCDVRGGYTDARLFECDPYSFLLEDVYGTVTRPDGREIRVSNTYDGHYLTADGEDDEYGYGEKVEIGEDDKVELDYCGH